MYHEPQPQLEKATFLSNVVTAVVPGRHVSQLTLGYPVYELYT